MMAIDFHAVDGLHFVEKQRDGSNWIEMKIQSTGAPGGDIALFHGGACKLQKKWRECSPSYGASSICFHTVGRVVVEKINDFSAVGRCEDFSSILIRIEALEGKQANLMVKLFTKIGEHLGLSEGDTIMSSEEVLA